MSKKRNTLAKISIEFDDILKRIANDKIRNGTASLDNRESFSKRRITLGLSRHRDIDRMVEDIVKADWDGDKPSRKRWRL